MANWVTNALFWCQLMCLHAITSNWPSLNVMKSQAVFRIIDFRHDLLFKDVLEKSFLFFSAVIAMELLSASQAVDLRNDTESKCKLKLSEPLEKIYNLVRSEVSYVSPFINYF